MPNLVGPEKDFLVYKQLESRTWKTPFLPGQKLLSLTFDDGDGHDVDTSFLGYIGDQGPDRFLNPMTPSATSQEISARTPSYRPA